MALPVYIYPVSQKDTTLAHNFAKYWKI